MAIDLKRYQLFGWDYDHFSPLTEKEINWYKNYAHRAGGPVLELACGTGRLLSRLAEIGYDVTGIDLSSKMTEIAKTSVGNLPVEIKNKILLVEGDITRFDFARQFRLIYIADNSFRELSTTETQISCLKAVHQHLAPNGLFLLTVRRFDFSNFVNGKREISWSNAIADPASGNKVSRKIEFTLSGDKKLLHGLYVYKIFDEHGNEHYEECPFVFPVMHEADYLVLFADTGFKADLFYDYSNQKNLVGQTMCFVCSK